MNAKRDFQIRNRTTPSDPNFKKIYKTRNYDAFVHKGDLKEGLDGKPILWLREFSWSFTKCEPMQVEKVANDASGQDSTGVEIYKTTDMASSK